MEFETYESELADYSLQDSPFYEASTPIIFNLSSTSAGSSVIVTNGSSSMADALNLTSKKSSMLMTAKCQTFKFDRLSNSDRFSDHGQSNDEQTFNNKGNNNSSSMKNCENADGIFPKDSIDLDNSGNGNTQTKKKRKCVTFLPNYVQVSEYYPTEFIINE